MKDKIFTVIWGLVFFFVFLLGALFGPCLRPLPYLRSSDIIFDRNNRRSSDDCTCVPCLPDKFCHKCGHKSRDCPRLSWYFRRVPKQ